MADLNLGKVRPTEQDIVNAIGYKITLATEEPETVGEKEIVLVVEAL